MRFPSGTWNPVKKPEINMLPIFIKSGTIIGQSLAQDALSKDILLIDEFRKSSDKGLIIALDDDLKAVGEQYWDDGNTPGSDYAEIEYKFEDLELIAQLNDAHSSDGVRLSDLKFEIDNVWIGGLIGGLEDYNVTSILVSDNENVVNESYELKSGKLGDIEITNISPPVDLVHFKMTIKFEKLESSVETEKMEKGSIIPLGQRGWKASARKRVEV